MLKKVQIQDIVAISIAVVITIVGSIDIARLNIHFTSLW